jgi:hypothetical protein
VIDYEVPIGNEYVMSYALSSHMSKLLLCHMQPKRTIQKVCGEVIAKKVEEKKMNQFSYVMMRNDSNINNKNDICR